MINIIKKNIILFLLPAIIVYFFSPFLLKGSLPIPSDTIVGLYYPYRDFYSAVSPRGVAFKNFLITDPVRQTYPWKELSINVLRHGQIPTWNPYEMTGTPLAANFQSSPFYPLNILLFIFPFQIGWSIMIMLQPILSGIFLYLYLRNLRLTSFASVFGAITFAFSGFSVAWMEWNTISQTLLWLPLILLSIDKIINNFAICKKSESKIQKPKTVIQDQNFLLRRKNFLWPVLLIFSLSSSLFAGHLQTFFYIYFVVFVYFIFRWISLARSRNLFVKFIIFNLLFISITAIQWLPTLQFILLSARAADQADWTKAGWFLPWQNLSQFIAPDFFGNPATLNYWGVWNYGEFIGYIGIIPLFMAIFAILFRHDKKTYFFAGFVIVFFIFVLPTPLAQLPYILRIPFFYTSQPTRMIAIIDFSLAVLASLGIDFFIKRLENHFVKLKQNLLILVIIILASFIFLWIVVFLNNFLFMIRGQDIAVSARNLLFQTVLFIFSSLILFLLTRINRKKLQMFALFILFLISAADLTRFAQKFESFSPKEYLYPTTNALKFLKSDKGLFRIASTDSKILPSNFPMFYRLQSIEGYDPLYLLTYGEYITAAQRNSPDISPPFGFNRIVAPRFSNSPLLNLLNVKYILSFQDLDPSRYSKVFQEGSMKVFRNNNMMPRAFFVESVFSVRSKQDSINKMFQYENDLRTAAVVEGNVPPMKFGLGIVRKILYEENMVKIQTENPQVGFLVFTDAYYPTWRVTINNKKSTIFKTDYAFRGVIIPKGKNTIVFKNFLF